MIEEKELTKNLKELQEILNYSSTDELVVTLYLLVNPKKTTKQNYTTELNSMIVEKKAEIEKNENYTKSQKKGVFESLENIKNYINEFFIPGLGKTILLYAYSGKILNIVELPFDLKSRIIVDPKPHTQILRTIISSTPKYGVLVLDREKAQLFTVYLGDIKEYLEAFVSEVPPKVNYRSQLAFREKNILSRIEEKLHHFFKYINEKTLFHQRSGKFDYLIVAGRKDLVPQFLNYLHSFLQQKYIGSIFAEPDESPHTIKEKVKNLIENFERRQKDSLVDKLIDEYNTHGIGVLGIEATVKALMMEQAKQIIYDSDFQTDGYVCKNCNYISLKKDESCPYCGGEMFYYNDVTDEIIEYALKQGCELIEVVGNQRLIEAGKIGAVLRFRSF